MVFNLKKIEPEASIDAILFPRDVRMYQGTLRMQSPYGGEVESVPVWIDVPVGHPMDSPYVRLIKPIARTRLQENILPFLQGGWFKEFEIGSKDVLKTFLPACPVDMVPRIRVQSLPMPTYRLIGTMPFGVASGYSYVRG